MKFTINTVVNQNLYDKVHFTGEGNIAKGLRIIVEAYDVQAVKKQRIEALQKEIDKLQTSI